MPEIDEEITDAGSWLVVAEGDLPLLGAYLAPESLPGTPFTILWDGNLRAEPIFDFCRTAADMFAPYGQAASQRGRVHARGKAQLFEAEDWLTALEVEAPDFLRMECHNKSEVLGDAEGFIFWGRALIDGVFYVEDQENLGIQLQVARLPALERHLVPLITATQTREIDAWLILDAIRELERHLRPRSTPQAIFRAA